MERDIRIHSDREIMKSVLIYIEIWMFQRKCRGYSGGDLMGKSSGIGFMDIQWQTV